MRPDTRRKAQLKANKEAARQRSRDYLANYFATHSCSDCGESDPVVLTFDHVRGAKRANVSDLVGDGLRLDTIKAEVEKCDVVCYNCHSPSCSRPSAAGAGGVPRIGALMDRDMTCKELVELVTEYLEGALPTELRARMEQHLSGCDGCTNYLEQMRRTICLTGQIREENLTPPQRSNLLRLFRDWKKN